MDRKKSVCACPFFFFFLMHGQPSQAQLKKYFEQVPAPCAYVIWYNTERRSLKEAREGVLQDWRRLQEKMRNVDLELKTSLAGQIPCRIRLGLIAYLCKSHTIGQLTDFNEHAVRLCNGCAPLSQWQGVVQHFTPPPYPTRRRADLFPTFQHSFETFCTEVPERCDTEQKDPLPHIILAADQFIEFERGDLQRYLQVFLCVQLAVRAKMTFDHAGQRPTRGFGDLELCQYEMTDTAVPHPAHEIGYPPVFAAQRESQRVRCLFNVPDSADPTARRCVELLLEPELFYFLAEDYDIASLFEVEWSPTQWREEEG